MNKLSSIFLGLGILIVSTGCVTRRLSFEYVKEDGSGHKVSVVTTGFLVRAELSDWKDNIQTSELIADNKVERFNWTSDNEAKIGRAHV